ncbi:MAG: methyltransferase [Chlamydiales bacterium]
MKNKEMRNYQIGEIKMTLGQNDSVASPVTTEEFLTVLHEQDKLHFDENTIILDFGSGNGMIGIYCGLMNAGQVVFLDKNPEAVKLSLENATAYQLRALGFVSDCFAALKGKYDYILANCPMQPILFSAEKQEKEEGFYWNENENGGRFVLNTLICHAREYLKKSGKVYLSCSSRQGHQQTMAMVKKHWPNSWKTIYCTHYPLSKAKSYLYYIPLWLEMQRRDLDLRIFQLDSMQRRFSPQVDDKGEPILISEIKTSDGNKPVKFIKNGDVWLVQDQQGNLVYEVGKDSLEVPGPSIDGHWYSLYYILELDETEESNEQYI